jgi:hypothetical protein
MPSNDSKGTSKPAAKKIPKPVIYIQSPYGGEITPEEVWELMPEGTETCYVRVDQNLIWWVRKDGETGAVRIWGNDWA